MTVTEINERIFSAVSAWEKGDVYSAWKMIGDVCEAPWVNEVLKTLDLREPLVQQRTPKEEACWQDERAKKIRSDIEEEISKASSEDGDPPPIKESVKTLKQFLEAVDSDDSAIAWLRDSARNTVERLNEASESPLKVAILGEFSSGKSRLINALLGEKILSIGLVPVTRSVTRIVYGDEIRVTVKHLDGSAVDVPPDQLKAYTDERKKEDGASEVEEVILEYPAPVLKQVEIWDTPGFNSNNQLHDQVAAQLMLEADAVLWVIAAHQVGSRSETKLLEIVKRAQGKVVGVLNQIDRLESTEAIEQQKSEAWNHYGEMVKEVVPTSGKWLEEKREEANRGLLLDEIEKIGSWSQEQRNRKEARRVGVVAAQTEVFIQRIEREKEERYKDKKIREAQKDELSIEAMKEWEEVLAHMLRLQQIDNEQSKTHQKFNNKKPLQAAYIHLLNPEIPIESQNVLSNCLWSLEEIHWYLCTAWHEDLILLINRLRRINSSENTHETTFINEAVHNKINFHEILKCVLGQMESRVPTSVTGGLGVQDIISRLENINRCMSRRDFDKWLSDSLLWIGSESVERLEINPGDISQELSVLKKAGDSAFTSPMFSLLENAVATCSAIEDIQKLDQLVLDSPNDIESSYEELNSILGNQKYMAAEAKEKNNRATLNSIKKVLSKDKLVKLGWHEPFWTSVRIIWLSSMLLIPTGGFSAIGYLGLLAPLFTGVVNGLFVLFQCIVMVPIRVFYEYRVRATSDYAMKHKNAAQLMGNYNAIVELRVVESDTQGFITDMKKVLSASSGNFDGTAE